MLVTDAMISEWAKRTGCTFDYLESLSRGGYFDDVQPEQIERHLALIILSRESQTMELWK